MTPTLTYDHDIAEIYARHRGVRPELLKTLVEESGVNRSSRLLEVGCGTGNYVIATQFVSGCAARGVDISEEMLAHAQRRDSPVEFSVGTAEFLEVADGSQDVIFTIDVVHHFGSPADHYREAYRALAPEGRICTVTHSEDMFRNTLVLAKYFPETIEVNLDRYPPVATLHHAMSAAGFRYLREIQIAFPAQVTDSGLYARRAYSPLHEIEDDAFARGLEQLEADLAKGPIKGARQYLMIWGTK
jgi:ubiquinone/menaquinone biosynthesis C-methylase UbiE